MVGPMHALAAARRIEVRIDNIRPLSGSFRELCTRFERASCGGPQADGFKERIEVGDDALIETVESMALLFGEAAVGGDRFQEPAVNGA